MLHKESQETKDFITQWVAPNFFYSKTDVWHRFGMLGVFGDYVLSCTQGDIFEIGVGESSIYLGYLARKYHRRIYHCDVARGKIINPLTVDGYLTEKSFIPNNNDSFFWVDNSAFFIGTSDKFFEQAHSKFCLSFIDGDHNYEQVKKDFDNTVSQTVDNGYILLHDTHPPSEDFIREERCGTVYKLRQEIEGDSQFDCLTLPVGCAVNAGLTIVRKKPKNRPYYNE